MTTTSAHTHHPDATDELPARARALRRAGMSTAQIARELGVAHNGTLSGWLRGVPPPEWTRRPGAKDDVRRQARELRASGKTYEEIAAVLGVSKSTCSLWLRDLAGSPGQAPRLAARRGQRRHEDDETLRLRATELRARGMTVRQVRRELGIGNDHLTRVLAGGPRIDLRRERDRSQELRSTAKLLHSRGNSYRQIALELGLASSTVGVWCRDLGDAINGRSGPERRAESIRRAGQRRAAQRQQALLEGAREVGGLSDRELMLLGVALYWAEGAKSKPWRLAERIVFVNSDPTMVNVFLRWLELMDVEPDRRTFRVQIHDSADVDAAVAYWAELIGVSPHVFETTTLKRHNPKTTRKNVGECYHGCLRIEVRRSAELYRRVAGAWFGIADASRRRPPRAP